MGDQRSDGFDRDAAITRSLLGYGVLAGAFYLVVGLILALTREGFELGSHALSLLMLGEHGWMQRTNLIVTGAMTLAATAGFVRALRGTSTAGRAGTLLGVFGVSLVVSGVFAPDPMGGFPPGTAEGDPSVSGILHLAAGGIGFLSLTACALVLAGWLASGGLARPATLSRVAAAVIVLGFLGGAALATSTAGVLLLWLAVVTGWGWLAGTSILLYRTVPHPDLDRRTSAPAP